MQTETRNGIEPIGGLGKDLGFSVQQTNDGGYIIAGGKKSFWIIGNYDVWVIKTDPKGNDRVGQNLWMDLVRIWDSRCSRPKMAVTSSQVTHHLPTVRRSGSSRSIHRGIRSGI